jgi:hypothetical protein
MRGIRVPSQNIDQSKIKNKTNYSDSAEERGVFQQGSFSDNYLEPLVFQYGTEKILDELANQSKNHDK